MKEFNIEKSLKSLFDKGDTVLFRWNNDEVWSIDYVSSSVEKLLGFSTEDFMSGEIAYISCIYDEDLALVFEEVQQGMQNKNEFFKHKPYRVVTKDDEIKWVLDHTAVEKDKDGNITHFLGYISDITQVVQTNEENFLFKQIVEHIDTGIVVADATVEGMPLIYVNPMFEEITQYSKEEILGKNCNFLQSKDRDQEGVKIIKKALQETTSCEVEVRNYKKNNEMFWNLLTLTPIFDSNNLLRYYVGSQHDITAHKQMFEQLKKMISLQNNMIILSDGEEIAFANHTFFEFFDFKDLEDFKRQHKCICDLFVNYDKFFHLGKLSEEQNWVEEIQKLPEDQRIVAFLGKNFELHAFSVHVNSFEDDVLVVSFTDISQTVLKTIQLEEKTIHDKLTNAHNREFFEMNYRSWIHKSKQDKRALGLAFLDIDHFKKVNDTYGHDVGDDVLCSMVSIVKKNSREEDILIRWGGEEFILIVFINDLHSFKKVLENIRLSVSSQSIDTVGHITCSIGGTLYKDEESIQETIKRADNCVYEAKRSGRDKVIIV